VVTQAAPTSAGLLAARPTGLIGERNKLYDAVVSFYEAAIFNGTLQVGTRLPSEAEIARLFAVSTRTIRDALQVLETKGLVQRRHGECAIVVRNDVAGFLGSLALTVKQLFSTNAKYFLELMDVRRIIELDVVASLASAGGTMNAEVTSALAGMQAAVKADDAAALSGFDAAFHLGLVHSTPNKVLHVLYENLYGLIAEVIQVTSRVPAKSLQDAHAEHDAIHRLIAGKDAEGARAAMARHIEGSAGYLKVALGADQGDKTGASTRLAKARPKSRTAD
jgi:GntR family transcriptional repressor for pyruvate dehydrogenase complex